MSDDDLAARGEAIAASGKYKPAEPKPAPPVESSAASNGQGDYVAPVADYRRGADAAALLDDIRAFLSRFVVYPSEHELNAHTLWIGHARFMDYWESTPRIAFLSPEPASGKSRALEVTEPLVPRPVHAVNTTPAYLFRKVSDPLGAPTILYDEIDTVFGPKAKEHEEIRGMLNAGHRNGATAGRCVVRGKEVFTEELPAYCAVALAGLDDLPDTLMTRSVVVRMRRRAPDEHIQPWRQRITKADADALAERLRDWANTADPLENGWPAMPDGVEDRDADVWEALLAVADLAGGHWPQTARTAAVTLVTASRQRPLSIGVLLLADIKKVFATGADRLHTEDIVGRLVGMDEAPWATIRKGEPIDARSLAGRLRKYGISSKAHRTAAGVFKGYLRAQFEDAWKRYVDELGDKDDDGPPVEGNLSVTSVTTETQQVNDGADLFSTGGAVTDDRLHGYNPQPQEQAVTSADTRVTDVTDPKGDACTKCGDELTPSNETAADTCISCLEEEYDKEDKQERKCACGNALLTPDSINSGKCKPCRDKSMAGYDQ